MMDGNKVANFSAPLLRFNSPIRRQCQEAVQKRAWRRLLYGSDYHTYVTTSVPSTGTRRIPARVMPTLVGPTLTMPVTEPEIRPT